MAHVVRSCLRLRCYLPKLRNTRKVSALDDSVDLSIVLLMASVHNRMVSRSTEEASTASTNAYLSSKVHTLRTIHKKLAHKWGMSEAVVTAFIIGGLIGAEVSRPSDRLRTAFIHCE